MDKDLALTTIKSFKEIMSPEDFDTFIKGEDSEKLRAFPEVQEFLKAETKSEEENEEHEADETTEKENKEEKEEKGVTAEMFKSLEDSINSKLNSMVEILRGVIGDKSVSEQVGELQKSMTSISETLEGIKNTPQGRKAIKNGSASFFEKSMNGEEVQDDNGKKVLSVGLQQNEVIKAMEDGLSKATDDDLKRAYEGSIIRYNGGGGRIDQSVAMDLYEKHNIRLVR